MDAARLEELFDAARRLAGAERAAYLARECEHDPELEREVQSLLAHLDDDPEFLQKSAAEERPAIAAKLGTLERIGSYRLIRLLGEGGMGAVFLAEQDNPRREVAIKIVHPAFVSDHAAARLRREGEALGRLQHPAIAKVIEVGETEGPFDVPLTFVAMELVQGEPITRAAERLGLDTRARLELVSQLADALAHAHERGVVHRDLKPSNVLLSDDGRPQVLDFGIARLLDERGAPLTATGQTLGTPSYMAPEQLHGGSAGASPLVDVYALGALAYELLAGRPPFAAEGRAPSEILWAIENEEPIPLRRLVGHLEADVATIVHKALERDPHRRYQSAAELASDLRRTLRNEPIHARPPSAIYRVALLARRRRAAVVALGATLAIALVASTLIARSRSETLGKAEQVRGLLGMVEAGFNDKDPFERGELDPADAKSLDDAEAWIEDQLTGHPILAAELMTMLARIHRNRGNAEHARTVAARALELCAIEPDGAALETASARSELGLALVDLRRSEAAEPVLRAAHEQLRALGPDHRKAALAAQHNLAISLKDQRQFDAAERVYRDCLREREALLGPDHKDTAVTRAGLARLLQDSGRDLRGAVELLRLSAASDARTQGRDVPYTLVTYSQLAGALTEVGELDEAETLLLEVVSKLTDQLGSDHPDALASQRNLVKVYSARGDHAMARAILSDMVPDMRARFGAVDYRTLEILTRLARTQSALRDWPAAIEAWEEVETVAVDLYGPEHADAVAAGEALAHATASATR